MNESGPCALRSLSTCAQVNSSVRSSPVSGNSAGSSPAGATGPKSTTSARPPPAGCTTIKPIPPSPLFHGSRTESAKAVATTASTAVPPAARISAPTLAATPFCETTMPPREAVAGLRTCQFWVKASMSADLDPVDPITVERVMPGEAGHLVVRRLVTPDRVFRAAAADRERPIRGGALERAIGVVLGLFHQIEPHVLLRDVHHRAVAGLLDAQRAGAVGDDRAGIGDAHPSVLGTEIDAM